MGLGIINYKEDLLNLVDEYTKIGENYLSKEDFGNKKSYLNEFVVDRINSLEPKIMVYGIYNAGKSTLLNALQGRVVAKTADKPETDKITPYDWNGYTLMDTPGIDAPIEHEEISKENLKKSDVVLYVISTNGTFDDKRNYEEMCNIIDNSKKLIIILNNKNGYEVSSPEVIKIKEKVVDNIAKFSNNINVGLKYSILLVNAKTALKAKLENKKNLLERSNIKEIETELMRSFKEIKAFDMLKAPIHNFLEEVDFLKQFIGDTMDDSELSNINNVQEVYQEMIQNIKSDSVLQIKNMLMNYQGELASKIAKGESTEDLVLSIQNMYSKIVESIYLSFKNIEINDKELGNAIDENIKDISFDDKVISMKDVNLQEEYSYEEPDVEVGFSKVEVSMSEPTLVGGSVDKKSISSGSILPLAIPVIKEICNILNKREERKYLEAQASLARLNLKAQEEANRTALIKQESNSLSKSFLYEIEMDINNSISDVICKLKDVVDDSISVYYDMKSSEVDKHLEDLDKLRAIENRVKNIKNDI